MEKMIEKVNNTIESINNIIEEDHKKYHEDGVIAGIVTNGALPYCTKDEKNFLEALKATNECEYGQNDLFVNYNGKDNVFVEHYSLVKNKDNNKSKRGRVVFMQHGLDGIVGENPDKASDQYIEFQKMVEGLKGKTAKNGFEFESLGIITKRKKSINNLKETNTFITDKDDKNSTYLFFNDYRDKERAKEIGMSALIYEKTENKNILIRTEFSTGQTSFENQRNEMAKIVSMVGKIDDEIDVTFIGHSMGGIVSINYGIDYAKLNRNKDIDIITISTPYDTNFLAKMKSDTPAREDLASESTRKALIEKWDKKTENIELCAIGVAKAGLEDSFRAIFMGDSIVNLRSQLGYNFNNISSRYLVVNKEEEKKYLTKACSLIRKS